MTPVAFHIWRDIARHDAFRAERLWLEGLAVAACAEDTGGALTGSEAADLSGRLMQGLTASVPPGPGNGHLAGPLLAALRLRPGWALRSHAGGRPDALTTIGAALALVAIRRGLAGLPPCPVVLSHDPHGGVALRLG